MKLKLNFLAFLLIFILFHCATKSDTNQTKQDIRQLIIYYTAAFDQKDFQKFISYCSDDFKFFTLDGQAFDKESAAGFLNKILRNWTDVRTLIQELEIYPDNSLAFARYKADMSYSIEGQAGTLTTRVTVVFKRNKGDWKILQYHISRQYF